VAESLQRPHELAAAANRLQARVRAGFSVEGMTDAVIAGYREALADKKLMSSAKP
jgi:hypothetical protein